MPIKASINIGPPKFLGGKNFGGQLWGTKKLSPFILVKKEAKLASNI